MESSELFKLFVEDLGGSSLILAGLLFTSRMFAKTIDASVDRLTDEVVNLKSELQQIAKTNQELAKDMAVIVKEVEHHTYRIERLELR